MGAGPNVCTWKSFGKQNQFVSGADVAAACFGHMVASVWDGSNVRWRNRDRLKQCLALSVSEVGNGADAPPQHAWAASLLDACELHELRARRSRAPTGGSSCSGSSEDDENHCSGMESGELYAWVGNKSTLRHLRILLERGCESCTRNTPQDNMRECDNFNIDFSTCCL